MAPKFFESLVKVKGVRLSIMKTSVTAAVLFMQRKDSISQFILLTYISHILWLHVYKK